MMISYTKVLVNDRIRLDATCSVNSLKEEMSVACYMKGEMISLLNLLAQPKAFVER
jgi:hypothetical protein